MREWRKHYQLHVFGHGYRAVRQVKASKSHGTYTAIEPSTWGIQGWNPRNEHEPGRLPESGSFTWVGIVAVRHAAMEYLARPNVTQVQVLTNQSRKLYIWNRHGEKITGYMPDPERG